MRSSRDVNRISYSGYGIVYRESRRKLAGDAAVLAWITYAVVSKGEFNGMRFCDRFAEFVLSLREFRKRILALAVFGLCYARCSAFLRFTRQCLDTDYLSGKAG